MSDKIKLYSPACVIDIISSCKIFRYIDGEFKEIFIVGQYDESNRKSSIYGDYARIYFQVREEIGYGQFIFDRVCYFRRYRDSEEFHLMTGSTPYFYIQVEG